MMDTQTTDIQLQFDVRDGKVVSIADITDSERGLKCNCVCPFCETRLEAKMGKTRKHHFAHHNASCNIRKNIK